MPDTFPENSHSHSSSSHSHTMFIELMATQSVLEKWERNPHASKIEIGVWSHWREPTEENRLPLSRADVLRMKRFLKKHAPTNYRMLFGGDV